MEQIEQKAVRLVHKGRVRLEHVSEDGAHLWGYVKGDSGIVYRTSIDPFGYHCDCVHGQQQPGHRHSHPVALQLINVALGEGIPVEQLSREEVMEDDRQGGIRSQ